MLLVASAVFLYYTIWTLFIVCSSSNGSRSALSLESSILYPAPTNSVIAIRGRRPPTPRPFPPPRLGNPYPRDPHPCGHRRGRQFLERGHDQEREEEGCEREGEGGGTREEEELSATFLVGRGRDRRHIVYVLGLRGCGYQSREGALRRLNQTRPFLYV